MSIKAIALELYRAQQKVSGLEAQLEKAQLNEKETLRKNLCEAKAEWQVLRKILNGKKAPLPFRSQPSSYSR